MQGDWGELGHHLIVKAFNAWRCWVARSSRRNILLAAGAPVALGLVFVDDPGSSPAAHPDLDFEPIPAFARQYRTACSTCHTAAPKLNVLGEAFRLNGYRMPASNLLIREDDPVSLGAEPWKDLWPRAIWPGTIPGQVPLALRIQSDLQITRDSRQDFGWTYRLPHEIYLLAGTTFGDGIGAFFEAEWSEEEGLEVVQAKVKFQDLLPFLPERALNLWAGLQDPYLMTFTGRQIDRAARQKYSWQSIRLSDLITEPPGFPGSGPSDHKLGGTFPSLEFNGLLGSRTYWGVGLAQGLSDGATDRNHQKDVYLKLRHKIGGLDLEGNYSTPEGTPDAYQGQLLDRSLILEGFAYWGDEGLSGEPGGEHRAYGFAARWLHSRLDAGVGFVVRRFDPLWLSEGDGSAEARAAFARAEYMFWPWVIGSLKFDRLTVGLPSSAPPTWELRNASEGRVMPGVILLLRQNLRAVIEGEWFTLHRPTTSEGLRKPHNLWIRLDLAF